MCTKSLFMKCTVIIVVILVLAQICYCGTKVRTKNRKKNVGEVRSNYLWEKSGNYSNKEQGRGFGSLFSLGKVLNFFPVGGEKECKPEGLRAARAGVCLNPYDCRQRDGAAAGDCAAGLGVCCVFEVSCGGVVSHNLTYISSPGFPDLTFDELDCNISIDQPHAGITQLRIDFVHFSIGQPNRTTGACDEDAMILGDGPDNFTICGQNHGQHIYYTLPTKETRELDELPSMRGAPLRLRLRGGDSPRFWLLRLALMPLAQSAPHGCLQYYTESNGTIRSFNYASNGRHLAGQDYKACIRRNTGFCGVRYTQCDSRSFRIGPSDGAPQVIDPAELVADGGVITPGSTPAPTMNQTTTVTMDQQIMEPPNGTMQQDEMMPADETQQDEEGSGNDPGASMVSNTPQRPTRQPKEGFMSMIWSFIWPSWIWGQGRSLTWGRWSPYTQHYQNDDKYRYYGYGNFGAGMSGFGRQRCTDRVTIPCENEYFVSSSTYLTGVCDPHHCGGTLCPGVAPAQCRVETSIAPFAVSFHFGPPRPKRSPDENIGVCLRYMQLPCDDG